MCGPRGYTQICICLILRYLAICSGDISKLKKPLIVWWYHSIFPHIEEKDKELYDVSCGHGIECYASKSRSLLKQVDVASIIFYGTDFEPDDLPLPKKKQHLWALLHEESPKNSFLLCQTKILELFNLSATFKSTSDYPLTTQYIPSIGHLLNRMPLSFKEKNRYRNAGLAPVIYVQSNCDTPSDRDRYVSELMKYVKIDSYGDCLRNKDLDFDGLDGMKNLRSDEFLHFVSKYKFHIAFENAVCDDYVTEKLYRALHVGSVPIYMGASNVDEWSPKRSVIKVTDFPSPEALGKFIVELDEDETKYSAYLEYKKDNRSLPDKMREAIAQRKWSTQDFSLPHFVDGFECFACEKMHGLSDTDGDHPTSTPSPENKFTCPPPRPSIDGSVLGDDKLKAWIAEFEQSELLGAVLAKVIENGDSSAAVWDLLAKAIMNARDEL